MRATGFVGKKELTLGVPGQTYDSFCDEIEALLAAGEHDGFVVSNVMFADGEEPQGIRTVKTEVLKFHEEIVEGETPEYCRLVVGTDSMSNEMWAKAALFSCVVQAFHCLNLTGIVADEAVRDRGLTYRKFYEGLINHFRISEGFAGQEFRELERLLVEHSEGRKISLNLGCRDFGSVMLRPEEALFLRMLKGRHKWVEPMWNYMHRIGFGYNRYVVQFGSTRSPAQFGVGCDWSKFARDVVIKAHREGTMRRSKKDHVPFATGRKPLVSILIPSRHRVERLKRCLESIKDCTPEDDYEVLIRFDDDDQESIDAVLQLNIANVRCIVGDASYKPAVRGFTPSLSHYFDEMALEAVAPWVWIMNDDTMIEGENWIDELRRVPLSGYKVEAGVYKLNESRYTGCFPFPFLPNLSWIGLGCTALGNPTDAAVQKLYVEENDWKVELLPSLLVWHDWIEPILI